MQTSCTPKHLSAPPLKEVAFPLDYLPSLGALARLASGCGAFVRARALPDVLSLLHVLALWTELSFSFRSIAAHYTTQLHLPVSDEALRKRCCNALPLLQTLFTRALQRIASSTGMSKCLNVLDATTIVPPGKSAQEWRLHTTLSLSSGIPLSIVITDKYVAEGYNQGRFEPGAVVLADSIYGRCTSMAQAQKEGVALLSRFYPETVRLLNEKAEPIDLKEWLRQTPCGIHDRTVRIQNALKKQDVTPVRVVILQLPEEQASRARQKHRAKVRHRTGREPTAAALLYVGYVCLITTLTEAQITPKQLGQLYRYRWQVELWFKRAKSLMKLDGLPICGELMTTVWLTNKLLHILSTEQGPIRRWTDDKLMDLGEANLSEWQRIKANYTDRIHRIHVFRLVPSSSKRDSQTPSQYLCERSRKRVASAKRLVTDHKFILTRLRFPTFLANSALCWRPWGIHPVLEGLKSDGHCSLLRV